MKQELQKFRAMNSVYITEGTKRGRLTKLELYRELNILNNFEPGAVQSKGLETFSVISPVFGGKEL